MLMSRAHPFGGVFVMRDRAELVAEEPKADGRVREVSIAGQPLLVDPGTVVTHRGAFHWESALEVTADVWCSTAEFDLLEARVAHNADGQTVVHRRRILRVGPDRWLIADDVGPEPASFELQLQCEPSVCAAREHHAALRLSRPLSPDVLVHVSGPVVSPWHISEAWVSPAYAAKPPATAVGCSVGEQGGRSSMLICQESDYTLSLADLEAEGGECIAVHGSDPAYVLVKAPGVDYVRSAIARTDADIAWIWPATADRPARYLAIRGSRVEFHGETVTGLGGPNGWSSGSFSDAQHDTAGDLNRPEWNG